MKEGKVILSLVTDILKSLFCNLKVFIKWILIAVIVGALGGGLGSIFHKTIDYVTDFRQENVWLIFFLPLGGILIAAIYNNFKKNGKIDTNRVIESVRGDERVPLIMAPLIFIATVLTHMLGGSAGREGAALQLGGSIGYNLGKIFKLNKQDTHIIVMSGMSSVFSAMFGTPLAAAFFALEVTDVGIIHYAGLVPCIISSVVSYRISLLFGISPVRFNTVVFQAISTGNMIKAIVLALLCALLSSAFCITIKKCEFFMKKFMPNDYIRAFVGGIIIILLTLVLRTYDYNGAGMDVITGALQGEAKWEAFALKILFTAITISAGFKGGEIVPTFFIGSTFGCVVGPLLGLEAGFGAAIGFIALFCGVVNCPVASIMLSIEVFGTEGILFFAIACGVSYMMSGYFGLYKSQKIIYSKFNEDMIDINTK